MRGLKRNPWLFGRGVLLAILVVYGGHARADVFTDQSGSIVVFPKVIADGTRDTIIMLTNTANMPAQAHCFYVNALGFCNTTVNLSCRPGSAGFCSGTIPSTMSNGASNGASSLSCESTADCPLGETCVPVCPAGETCVPVWEETDFDLFLTGQQPTQWRVSTGRVTDIFGEACNLQDRAKPGWETYGTVGCSCTRRCSISGDIVCDANYQCPANETCLPGLHCPGLDPGTGSQGSFAVIPVGTSFEGELKCIQTLDDFQTPVNQNSLKGEAIIETLASGQVSEYNAIGISGLAGLGTNNDLLLNNVEYNACPRNLVLNHYADGATEDFSEATVNTELTLVPCTEIFEPQLPTRSRALFTIVNEFEQPLSAELTFDCYVNRRLGVISSQFTYANIGTQFAKTRISPPSSTICQTGTRTGLPCASDAECPGAVTTPGGTLLGCRPWTGLLGVAEEFHSLAPRPNGTAAMDLHMEGSRGAPGDIIVPPEGAN